LGQSVRLPIVRQLIEFDGNVSALNIRYERGGVYLPDLGLWLDARRPKVDAEPVFVSHAHTDHLGRHREVVLTAATSRLMQARLGGRRQEHVLAFGDPFRLSAPDRECQLTLLPAGHILGSAMAFIEVDGESLLYTGDFKLRSGRAAEPCAPRAAERLVMETTFGRPAYRFPPAQDVITDIVRFCREALAGGQTPVLLGYALGKSQELLRALGAAGLPVTLHEQACAVTRIYEQLGERFPAYEQFNSAPLAGRLLICPPTARHTALMDRIGPARTAVVSGWAIDPACRYRFQTDAAFPLSDHADFDELIEFVRQVSPKRVYTLHGFAADFAQSLRDLGFDARALSEPDQLGLRLTA
jgi:putative mRNA 3-end processing factor